MKLNSPAETNFKVNKGLSGLLPLQINPLLTNNLNDMEYYISKKVNIKFDEAIARVTETLKIEGFGVLTTIETDKVLKEKLGVDFPRYTILGSCNPSYAYEALQSEDKIGLMLPCNVIVRQLENDTVEVSAINPVVVMQPVENENLNDLMEEVLIRLTKAINLI
ncbi:MAG TPA: DUF302 domain-containing protein [Bacteroidales bacterium]|nr:DUF302 domain-containing protein [Bacteroidales bacterium]